MATSSRSSSSRSNSGSRMILLLPLLRGGILGRLPLPFLPSASITATRRRSSRLLFATRQALPLLLQQLYHPLLRKQQQRGKQQQQQPPKHQQQSERQQRQQQFERQQQQQQRPRQQLQQQCEEQQQQQCLREQHQQQVEGEIGERKVQDRHVVAWCGGFMKSCCSNARGSSASFSSSSTSLESETSSSGFSLRCSTCRRRSSSSKGVCCDWRVHSSSSSSYSSSSSSYSSSSSHSSSSRSGVGDRILGSSRTEDISKSRAKIRQNREHVSSSSSSSNYRLLGSLLFCHSIRRGSNFTSRSRLGMSATEAILDSTEKTIAAPSILPYEASSRNARAVFHVLSSRTDSVSPAIAAAADSSSSCYHATTERAATTVACAGTDASSSCSFSRPSPVASDGDLCLSFQLHPVSATTAVSAFSFSRNHLLSPFLLPAADLPLPPWSEKKQQQISITANTLLHRPGVMTTRDFVAYCAPSSCLPASSLRFSASPVSCLSASLLFSCSSISGLSASSLDNCSPLSSFSTVTAAAASLTRSILPAMLPSSRRLPVAATVAAANLDTRRGFSAPPPSLPSSFSASAASSSSAAAARAETPPPATAEESKQNFVLSIEEALYAAKEAHIYTTEELQKIILRSPSFSPDRSPVLLENMFSSMEAETPEKFAEEWGVSEDEDDVDEEDIFSSSSFQAQSGVDNASVSTAAAEAAAERAGDSSSTLLQHAGSIIPAAIVRAFNPSWGKTFTHDDREWKIEAEGCGTRKRAAAHVIIRLGSGQVRVNNDEDLYVRWPYYYNRMDVLQPLYLTNTATVYDIFIDARGGGASGQAAAARLAIGRALVNACPACQPDLEEDMVLYEDLRQRMPKMPGRMKARKTRAWTKR